MYPLVSFHITMDNHHLTLEIALEMAMFNSCAKLTEGNTPILVVHLFCLGLLVPIFLSHPTHWISSIFGNDSVPVVQQRMPLRSFGHLKRIQPTSNLVLERAVFCLISFYFGKKLRTWGIVLPSGHFLEFASSWWPIEFENFPLVLL